MTDAVQKPARRGRKSVIALTAETEEASLPASSPTPTVGATLVSQFMPWGESAADFNARINGLEDRLLMIDQRTRKER